jgi:hypothetical protein
MTTETAVAVADDRTRKLALLKAIGLDRLAPEQRELAISIANKYELDLLLKHLVMIEGRAYITRDGLLHIAHRSGQLDGIVTTEPVLDGDYWRASCSVYRKDMSHAFTYGGRYPAKGGNQKFAPEMAVKVSEVMALRRAFDVSVPTAEERWDVDVPDPAPKPTLAERVEQRRAEVMGRDEEDAVVFAAADEPEAADQEPAASALCLAASPFDEGGHCDQPSGHKGVHRIGTIESWPQ